MSHTLIGWIAILALAGGEQLDGHELRVTPERVTAEIGERGAVSLSIVPRAGFSISRDGPLRITLAIEPGEGVVLPRRVYQRRHAADERAEAPRFDLRYQAEAAGTYELTIDALFWVCRRHTCWPVRERREVPIEVRALAPPPTPDAGAPAD